MNPFTEWQEKVLVITILYRLLEKNEIFTADMSFTDIICQKMITTGLLTVSNYKYSVTDKGKDVMKQTIQALDVIRQFDVFGAVNVARVLTPDEYFSADEPFRMRLGTYDPRFDPNDPQATDMRLALLTWVGTVANEKGLIKSPFDPHEVVYIQKLSCGEFLIPDLWKQLSSGKIFSEIDKIVNSAYKWQDANPSDIENASNAMNTLYTAGMVETRKRDGANCSQCNTPLVLFEEAAKQSGKILNKCPTCNREFGPPPSLQDEGTLSCPKCGSVLYDTDRVCVGCGALIDYSMPSGIIETTTTTIVEPMFSYDYGYVSYGWCNPYDPFWDMALFGCFACCYW
jgi:DNA-directed RNA polymerase subunit RPC12/RpoP